MYIDKEMENRISVCVNCINLFGNLPETMSFKDQVKYSSNVNKYALGYGVYFTEHAQCVYPSNVLISIAERIGLSGENMNSSFHKSWKKIREASDIQLFIEQMLHYFSTYGLESIGINGEVYIPSEKLKNSIKDKKYCVKIIDVISTDDILARCQKLLNGPALKSETVSSVINNILFPLFDYSYIVKLASNISNKEARCMIYKVFNTPPSDPVEFLRCVVYQLTSSTLLIKSKGSIYEIQNKEDSNTSNADVSIFMNTYIANFGIKRVAGIYNRFKPIFLAIKHRDKLVFGKLINKIAKASKKYHVPYIRPYLETLTERIRNGEKILEALPLKMVVSPEFQKALDTATYYQKMRALNAIQRMRNTDATSIVYQIRNGKGYVTNFKQLPNYQDNQKMLQGIYNELCMSISHHWISAVHGKTVLIPEGIKYTPPTTEKQYVGQFPNGTCIDVKSDNIVVGVYWENLDGKRIDLDFSTFSMEGIKVGWDASYRDGVTPNSDKCLNETLFSGDMTDASKGASEMIKIGKNASPQLIVLNWFNASDDSLEPNTSVPYKFYIGSTTDKQLERNYMINPKNVKVVFENTISNTARHQALGIVSDGKLYLSNSGVGNRCTYGKTEMTIQTNKHYYNRIDEYLNIEKFITLAGGIIVREGQADIDLSPEKLAIDSISNLIER